MVSQLWPAFVAIENRNTQNNNPYTNINWLWKQGS
ncbi:hypothetical protein VII00023_03988 [Vibrio ichthyoenteri ATCC 700023]|uniref:Uncharacterized protein n=1 Tax=Vibrio ichthyoenteri ATCC 700023 TaxID=870968 RepID=F9S078_9VIBR|nr:hypothetical protein VII00023_03988 [Vibrio ichthyoenteri ATCC 700023]